MTGRGTVNNAVKQLGGCIVLAYSVIAWGILCSRREDSGVAVQATAMRRHPIDLLLLYCVRRPTVFSRFLVCQYHKPKESNVQLCTISEQNFSEHVLLFKNSPTRHAVPAPFSQISPPAQLRHRRTLVTHRRSHALGRSACLLSPKML